MQLGLAGCTADGDWETFAPDEYEVIPSVTGESDFIRRRKVPGLLRHPLFISAWNEWVKWKRFGLPHGRGWRMERPLVVRVIEICEQETETRTSAEAERNGKR